MPNIDVCDNKACLKIRMPPDFNGEEDDDWYVLLRKGSEVGGIETRKDLELFGCSLSCFKIVVNGLEDGPIEVEKNFRSKYGPF